MMECNHGDECRTWTAGWTGSQGPVRQRADQRSVSICKHKQEVIFKVDSLLLLLGAWLRRLWVVIGGHVSCPCDVIRAIWEKLWKFWERWCWKCFRKLQFVCVGAIPVMAASGVLYLGPLAGTVQIILTFGD